MLKRFLLDEKGATAIEYGLIAALISVAAIGGMTAIGSHNTVQLKTISDEMKN